MQEFNLIEETKEKYNKFYVNNREEAIKSFEDNKKIINEFYTSHFKKGEKNERCNSSNKNKKNK
jgi:predicted transcriptional regulator